MANAKKCDRCNAYYDENLRWKYRSVPIKGITFDFSATHSNKFYDLCDDCLMKLKDFLENSEMDGKRNNWHLCSEGIPTDEEIEYLLVVNGKWESVTYENAIVANGAIENGKWYIDGLYTGTLEVIAWQPYPKFEGGKEGMESKLKVVYYSTLTVMLVVATFVFCYVDFFEGVAVSSLGAAVGSILLIGEIKS